MSWSPQDHLRHFMYESIYKVLAKMEWPIPRYRVLDFGSQWFGDPDGGWQTHMRTMLKSIIGQDRFDHVLGVFPKYDIQKLSVVGEKHFDILIADQVLEHVQRPWLAASEIYRVLKPGGIAVVATPGLYPIHPSPIDCWRLMPDAYAVLFPKNLWAWLEMGTWGTEKRTGYEYLYNGAFPYGPPNTTVDKAMKQPYYTADSDKRCPLMVWWVGRKI